MIVFEKLLMSEVAISNTDEFYPFLMPRIKTGMGSRSDFVFVEVAEFGNRILATLQKPDRSGQLNWNVHQNLHPTGPVMAF